MVNKIEALADAIARLNAIHDPTSEAYKLRNPGLLKSFARLGKHETDVDGRRIFNSLPNGYKALLFDLELKIMGQSRTKLKPQSELQELLAVYGIRPAAVDNIVSFIRRALGTQEISGHTTLSYFTEKV